MSDGLFDMEPQQPLDHGALVDVTMVWGEVWQCEVVHTVREAGWPRVLVHRVDLPLDDAFVVDVARCRLL